MARKRNYDMNTFRFVVHMNLELVAKKGIIGKLEREALENKKTMETIQRENLELKQKLSKESEQTRVDTQSWKTKIENLEKLLKQSESKYQNTSLGMHVRFNLNLDFTS